MFGYPGGGSSAVIAPNGPVPTKNLAPTEEGIMYAILDHGLIALNQSFGNLIEHYSRPDLSTLVFDDRAKTHVVYHQDREHPQMNVSEKVEGTRFVRGQLSRK
jgi:nitrilase